MIGVGKRTVLGSGGRNNATEGAPWFQRGHSRAPVSPFQTTMRHHGEANHDTDGGHNKKRKQMWRESEETDNHKCPQVTVIYMSHFYPTKLKKKHWV